MLTLNVYQKTGRYYIDDPSNGFPELDNELISDIPEFFKDVLGPEKEKFSIHISTRPFSHCSSIFLARDNYNGGVQYYLFTGEKEYVFWFCKVFHFYFKGDVPNFLYFSIEG